MRIHLLNEVGRIAMFTLLTMLPIKIHSAVIINYTKVVNVATAGTLSSLLTADEKQNVTHLYVNGKLNGSDIVVLQNMANANLVYLDMGGANIVAGGSTYYTWSSSYSTQSYTTKANVVGAYMFYHCKTLQRVWLPNSATTIESGAFGYSSLREMHIGPNVTQITAGLCAGTPLETIELDNGNNSFVLDNGILYNKAKTTVYKAITGIQGTITLPSTVTTIENSSFSQTKLSGIVIPSKVTEIETATFSDCENLEEVTFPAGLTNLGYDCFGGCPKLKNIDLSGTKVTKIEMSFYNCKNIEEISLPSTLKEITGSSFTSYVLKKITCSASTPPTLEDASYHSFPFSYIASSCKVYVPKGRVNTYKAATGWKRFSYIYEIGSTPEDNITPTPGSEEINGIYYLFDDATQTATVTYRGTITGSGMSTQYDLDFQYYKGDIVIPSTVTRNGKVYTVKYIGRHAFYMSTLLKSVKMPDTISEIQLSAFNGCTGLVSVTFGQGLESIKNAAFWGCSSLANPEFPNSLTYIENHAFPHCTSITSLKLPDGLTSVAVNTFLGCTSLSSVALGKNIESIGYSAFGDCSSLTSIFIPSKVSSISYSSFSGCTSLTAIDVDDNNSAYCSVGGVLYNKAVTHLYTCPEGKEGRYDIPSTVQEIGEHGDIFGAFCNCAKLTEVQIPNSVTFIGWMAFSGCSALQKVVSYIMEPFEFRENAFSTWLNGGYVFSTATLYVPKGTKAKYLATSAWNKFNIIEEIDDTEEVCDVDEMEIVLDNMAQAGNTGTEDSPVVLSPCDEPSIDDDMDIDEGEILLDGTDHDTEPVVYFCGGTINIKTNAGFAFKAISMCSRDAAAASNRASSLNGGIKNSGRLMLINCTMLAGNYLVENLAGGIMTLSGNTVVKGSGNLTNGGAAYLNGTVSIAGMKNKKNGRIYVTSTLTNDINISIADASDVELYTPIVLGGNGYTLSSADADRIHLSLPEGFEWKYDIASRSIVIIISSGISQIANEQPTIVESFDATGRSIDANSKGLHIQRMGDGTIRKILKQ